MSTESFESGEPLPNRHFQFYFGISISILLLFGKCSRKTLNYRHLIAENNSCAFMRIESIWKCQCINILLRSRSFLLYIVCMTIWFICMYTASQLFIIFSFSLWVGGKLSQLCSSSTCSTAICIFIFTFIVAENAVLPARGNELCNKKRTRYKSQEDRERESDSILFTLCRRFYSCKPTLSSRFKAVKLVFCPTKPKWSVFSVVWYGVVSCGVVWCGVLLACGTCCIPHCGT